MSNFIANRLTLQFRGGGSTATSYLPASIAFAEQVMDKICNSDLNWDDAVFEIFEDDKIYYDTLPQCLKDIVNDMKTLENGKMSSVIKAFTNGDSNNLNYNWKILQTSDQSYFTGNHNLGNTQKTLISDAAWTRLNEVPLANGTDLIYMQVLLHEAYHAFMINFIRKNNAPLYYSPEFQNYEYKEIINETLDGMSLNVSQHNQFIRDKMVNPIAIALLEYSNLKGYDVNLQYCEDLAWAGLQETDAYNDDNIINSIRRDRIEEIIGAELTNTINFGHEPKGDQACQ